MTLAGPGSLTLSKAYCPKGSIGAENGYYCSKLFTLSMAQVDFSKSYNVGARTVSETDENNVISTLVEPGTPSTVSAFCRDSASGYLGEVCQGSSLPLYLVATKPPPNDYAMMCGSGQLQGGQYFERCNSVSLTATTSTSAPPTATFTVNQDSKNPFRYAFDGSNSLANEKGAHISSWSWTFGDGASASGKTVNHTFAKAGHYNVTLTVTDSKGNTGTYSVPVDPSGLIVTLDPGSTNGKLFSVEITVQNAGSAILGNVSLADQGAVTVNDAFATKNVGDVVNIQGPDPALPTTLSAGQSATSMVVFAIRKKGGVDLASTVSAQDASGSTTSSSTTAILRIGERVPSQSELLDQYTEDIYDGSVQAGTLINSEAQRYGDILDWATTQAPGASTPPWLNTTVADGTMPPSTSALPPVTGWKILAAQAAGLPDNALAWLPDNPVQGLALYYTMEQHIATSSAEVVKNTASGAKTGLENAAQFYGQLSSGDPAFQADALQQLRGIVTDAGTAAAPKIALLGSIIAFSSQDPIAPGSLGDFQSNPMLQKFSRDSATAIDATLKSSQKALVADVNLAKTDPQAAAAKIGDFIGSTTTEIAVNVATTEFGGAMVPKFAKAVEAALPAAAGDVALDASATLANPALAADSPGAPLAAVPGRATLESLGEEATISLKELQTLGGFYGPDAAKVQKIIKDVKAKYGVNVEVQVRPGNPASLQYYADGTGVPKPEWIKPKATEWTDVLLGAPPESLGKATLYEPVLPSQSVMDTFSPEAREALTSRYNTQKELYAKSMDPSGAFQQLLADSKTAGGATQSVGLGTSQITGLRYSLQDIPGHPGAKYIIDDAAGGKYVLSDADYQAVVSADTGKAIPAAAQRGPIELFVLNRLKSDTVSFGGHGWTVSGFDLPSQYSEPFIKFATGSMSPTDARSTLAWFLSSQTTQPAWLAKIATKLGRPVTVDDLMGLFNPGQFVVKFNGTTMRVGYGASLGK